MRSEEQIPLEALASTKINLLLDVVFNKEVGADGAVYFTKEQGSLSQLINRTDQYDQEQIEQLGHKAKNRIISEYSWGKIVSEYERLFLES